MIEEEGENDRDKRERMIEEEGENDKIYEESCRSKAKGCRVMSNHTISYNILINHIIIRYYIVHWHVIP